LFLLWLDDVEEEDVIMTLVTKLTIAVAGCSASSSAKMWHWLSVLLACLRAINPKQRLSEFKLQLLNTITKI
jgi:hypothetical protein